MLRRGLASSDIARLVAALNHAFVERLFGKAEAELLTHEALRVHHILPDALRDAHASVVVVDGIRERSGEARRDLGLPAHALTRRCIGRSS